MDSREIVFCIGYQEVERELSPGTVKEGKACFVAYDPVPHRRILCNQRGVHPVTNCRKATVFRAAPVR